MKLALLMSAVEARKPAVLITPEGPTSTPSRLSATDDEFGCTKVVVSPAPILKVFQLMMARLVFWLMTVELVPAPETVAEPPTTTGPSGPAETAPAPSVSSAVEVRSTLRKR